MIKAYKNVNIDCAFFSAGEATGIKHAGGWIPTDERLPGDFLDVLLQYNPTEEINEIMIGFHCPAGVFPAGGNKMAWFMNGEFYKNHDAVIAWMPLPEPYQPKDEEDNDRKEWEPHEGDEGKIDIHRGGIGYSVRRSEYPRGIYCI